MAGNEVVVRSGNIVASIDPIDISSWSDIAEVPINCAGAGDNVIVAAPGAGLRIYVLQYFIYVTGASNLKWRSATTDMSPAIPFIAGEKEYRDYNSIPWFRCALNQALNLNSSAAVQISGRISYVTGA